MRAKGLPAHKARRQLTPRIGDAREGCAESGIGRGLEILGFGERRGHEDTGRSQPLFGGTAVTDRNAGKHRCQR